MAPPFFPDETAFRRSALGDGESDTRSKISVPTPTSGGGPGGRGGRSQPDAKWDGPGGSGGRLHRDEKVGGARSITRSDRSNFSRGDGSSGNGGSGSIGIGGETYDAVPLTPRTLTRMIPFVWPPVELPKGHRFFGGMGTISGTFTGTGLTSFTPGPCMAEIVGASHSDPPER